MATWLWRRGTKRSFFCLLAVAIFLHSVLTVRLSYVALWKGFDTMERTQHGGYSCQQSREPTGLQRLVLMNRVPAKMFSAEASPGRPSVPPSPGRSPRVSFSPNRPQQAPVVLEDLVSPEEPPVSKIAALILSYSSDESLILGEMFNQHPDFFYMFEPLHPLEVAARSRNTTDRLKVRILHDVISCNFSAWGNHFKTYFKDEDFGGWQNSRDIQQACSISEKYFKLNLRKRCPILDQDIPTVLRAICVRRKHSAVTFAQTRNLVSLATLLREPDQGAPSEAVSGGLSAEDRQLLWGGGSVSCYLWRRTRRSDQPKPRCKAAADCARPARLGDVTASAALQDCHEDYCDWVLQMTRYDTGNENGTGAKPLGLRGRFAVVRHEDVVARPQQIARKVYSFVNLPLHPGVLTWLQENMEDNRTSHKLQDPVNGWQTALGFGAVKRIQEIKSCKTVMDMFGYKIVHVADLNRTAEPKT
ncbi:Carbohydrate sulfotransferase 1 [Branchiostoma belcheri]|nr:Carbohydrate sulfotransferase 1 [Branchiostoma belcheri]